jgi:predicted RNA-binding protein with RPS1 domain
LTWAQLKSSTPKKLNVGGWNQSIKFSLKIKFLHKKLNSTKTKTKEKTKATYVIFKKTKIYHIKWIKKEQNAGGWKKKTKKQGSIS